jgi:hypothetical protein
MARLEFRVLLVEQSRSLYGTSFCMHVSEACTYPYPMTGLQDHDYTSEICIPERPVA